VPQSGDPGAYTAGQGAYYTGVRSFDNGRLWFGSGRLDLLRRWHYKPLSIKMLSWSRNHIVWLLT
jgi:hypothetical protein